MEEHRFRTERESRNHQAQHRSLARQCARNSDRGRGYLPWATVSQQTLLAS